MKEKIEWSNSVFIDSFFNGKLRRKREYGNLYAVEGPDCMVLMFKTPHQNEKVLGVNFKGSNISLSSSSISGRLLSLRSVSKPALIFDVNLADLIEQCDITKAKLVHAHVNRVADNVATTSSSDPKREVTSALINIEGAKWLVEINLGTGDKGKSIDEYRNKFLNPVNALKMEFNDELRMNRVLYRISEDAKTVIEARESLVPKDVEQAYLFDNMWLIPTYEGFQSVGIEEEDLQIVSNPPTRFLFDLGPEFDDIKKIRTKALDQRNPGVWQAMKDHFSDEVMEKLNKYMRAYTRYENVLAKVNKPIENALVKGIRVSSNKKVSGGVFQDESGEVFVKGELYNMRNCGWDHGNAPIRESIIGNDYGDFGIHIASLADWHRIIPLEFI